MNADVRVIRLMRKILRDQHDELCMDDREQNNYFATDYFDEMKVEKKELSEPFTAIMGIWPDEEMDISDVAAQSYSLYCSEKMMDLEKDRQGCGDPFSLQSAEMPFLSVIQVHITPDVMAHALEEQTAMEVMDAFYKDLHDIVKVFIETYQKYSLVYRIYIMLSSGDFAVVLRSREADTAFQASSLLRKRGETDSRKNQLMFYKTYTLLTLKNDVIMKADKIEKNNMLLHGQSYEDCFVLRCCYSNLYWKDKEKVDKYSEDKNFYSGIQLYGLNGRYDFSVRVTLKQFLVLLNDIKEYKKTGKYLREKESENEDDIIKYIRYLMENRYLSYINERYLMTQDGCIEKQKDFDINQYCNKILTSSVSSRDEFLDYRINEIFDSVVKKYKKVRSKVNQIRDYRKNMKHYMNLLDKLIKLCYGINGFSDTRIYAAVLLEQLEIIIGSVEVYVEMYQRTEEKEVILYFLEEYIRESVCAVDGYAQYIRNNNLQSLQTPNYNIESNTSMEKLLIGYSEFLRVFTKFYTKYYKKKVGIHNKENLCEYLPIVVPNLSKGDVSVEALFPKGVINDWNMEMSIRENLNSTDDNRYCVVISVPTLTELGNVRTMVTSLFHEVAHQFRYESRRERNDALLKYLVHVFMKDIVRKLIEKLQEDTNLRDWDMHFGIILEKFLVDTYLEVNYKMDKGDLEYPYQNSPLDNFQYRFRCDINNVFESLEKKNDTKPVLYVFLKKIMKFYRIEKSKCPDAVNLLDKLFGHAVGTEDENCEMICEQIVKCAFGIVWDCACQISKRDIERIWRKRNFEEWITDTGEKIEYKEEWKKVFGGNLECVEERGKVLEVNQSDVESILKELWDIFYYFSCWIYESYLDNRRYETIHNKEGSLFIEMAYKKICKEWNGEKLQADLSNDFDNVLASMGRALGIDCDTDENFELFKNQITYIISQNLNYLVYMTEWRIKKYREETADMLMCNVMRLTPFGYMHMLAVNWPSNQELSAEYYIRSLNILLFQWCLDENSELSYSKFRQLCVQIINELDDVIRRVDKRLSEKMNVEPMLQPEEIILKWNNKSEEQIINLLDRIDILVDYCEQIRQRVNSKDDFFIEEEYDDQDIIFIKKEYESLQFYGIMANMMSQIVDQGREQIDYFNDFSELRDDYIRGISHLRDLNYEMRMDADPLVKYLGEFCDDVGAIQNEPYSLKENVEEKEKLNACSIEFLLNMYYTNKRRFSQKAGGIKCHL